MRISASTFIAVFFSAAILGGCGGLSNGLSSSTPISVAPQIAAPQSVTAGSTSQYLERSFARPLAGSGYKSLYSFKGAPDAANPEAGLIAVKNTLCGTSESGGISGSGCSGGGCGTVFAMSRAGNEQVLYPFTATLDGTEGPMTGLVALNGTLYGTTRLGGSISGGLGFGSVFEVSRSGTGSLLYAFQGGTDGASPESNLIALNGTLYGTTFYGGNCKGLCGRGNVFAITTSGKERVLYNFKGMRDGKYPVAPLIALNGTLYGTTFQGGGGSGTCFGFDGCGTVFKVSTSGKEQVVYRFKGPPDAAFPEAGLIAVNGELYGTTRAGGNGGPGCGREECGTVFAVSTSGQERVLYSFKGHHHDGKYPRGGLIAVNGALYGTTSEGGGGGSDACKTDRGVGFGCGIIFEISSSGKETIPYRFQGGTDGAYPVAGLFNLKGTLYGTTEEGGANGDGTVFSLSP
jgi:uncharacterized repeat protein (TIGR03803 family)